MTSREFCYWLQGLFELGDVKELSAHQVAILREHLNMVFYHEIDPSYGKDNEALNKLHNVLTNPEGGFNPDEDHTPGGGFNPSKPGGGGLIRC